MFLHTCRYGEPLHDGYDELLVVCWGAVRDLFVLVLQGVLHKYTNMYPTKSFLFIL